MGRISSWLSILTLFPSGVVERSSNSTYKKLLVLRKPEFDSSHGSMEEHHGQDHNEREESSGSQRGAEQPISSTLIDTLVERVVERVREQLAPPPSRNPAISSASPVTSEGMTGTIFEHCVPGKRLLCIGYVHLQGANVRGRALM